MPEQEKIEFDRLEAGHEFPPISCRLDRSTIDMFLKAVEETNSLYQTTELVPPMAIAAQAIAALTECVTPPPGSIHVSQELEFIDGLQVGETIICRARVIRKQERGKLRIMVVGLDVFNQDRTRVLAAKTSFMLPVQDQR